MVKLLEKISQFFIGIMARVIYPTLLILMLLGCAKGDPQMAKQNNSTDLSASQLEKVRSLRVYFGHQSVGKNILDGLQALGVENASYKLNIVETDSPENVTGPMFAHFRVGANMTPDSKIESFREHVLKSGNAVDLAFFKFCYVDVGADTDGEALFEKYQKMMSAIRQQHPRLPIMHVTIPVKSIDGGIKGIVKKVIGKSTGEEANINRTRYNELLRKEYQGKEPFFDLAEVESTAPDGLRVQGNKNGARYEALHPKFTDDGEHLNREGARRAAIALLHALADGADRIMKK
ncbi:hypothetical protein OR1_02878 [Geobacter sp. OR-1]|uniref:SGNH/GDSL hydrolase family protein n=1 Tax=Geobacter sp. OR-1 TaxID=1266765 RepID=UPI000541CFF1|nr:SGNH/GDSL hydrolase family protein [Geobacter sp. OR-1]GAM10589.1 hypothetical protein OR1_02878 [Geobacter sp. OR-1]